MSDRGYRLIGFVNFFNVIPSFIYPLFMREQKHYFQEGNTDDIIDKFVIADASLIERSEAKIIKVNSFQKTYYSVGIEEYHALSDAVYAFQLTENVIIWGDKKSVLEEIKKHPNKVNISSHLISHIREVYDHNFTFAVQGENDDEFEYLRKSKLVPPKKQFQKRILAKKHR